MQWVLITLSIFISSMSTTVYGDWGRINQLCGQFVYIYSPCCNWTSLYCPRMRLCDPRQCDYCTTYLRWKTICYFMGEYTLCTRSFIVHCCVSIVAVGIVCYTWKCCQDMMSYLYQVNLNFDNRVVLSIKSQILAEKSFWSGMHTK